MRRSVFTARAAGSDEPHSRIAVVAPGSLGTAVTRNRARRRVREAFRRAFASTPNGATVDLVITVRADAATAEFGGILADARAALAELGR
jgi:ribonuclease P protein component